MVFWKNAIELYKKTFFKARGFFSGPEADLPLGGQMYYGNACSFSQLMSHMNKVFLRKAASAGAGPASLFVTGVGFFCDFVKPFINLVPFFLIFSVLAAVGMWMFVVGKRFDPNHPDHIFEKREGKLFGITVVSTVFWAIMLPIFAITPEKGVAATVSPDIGGFQEALFQRLDVMESKIDKGFSDVLAKIDQIDANAGLIGNPQSPNDHYHNARIQELNGNLIQARKSYEEYFKSGLEYLDPYLSYQLILKNLEGMSTTREIFAKLREDHAQSPAVNLAYVLLKADIEDRKSLLRDLSTRFPDYGPIFFSIAEQYSYKEGMPTNEERRLEREALEKVVALEKDQKFSKFFVDKKLADEKLAWVDQEMKLMAGTVNNMLDNPVQFKIEMVNKSAQISFVPTEAVQKIFYRVDEQGEFRDTGSMGVAMAGSTTPLPNYYTLVPMTLGDHVVEMKYIDQKGKESPVYKHQFTIDGLKIQNPPYKMIDPKTGKEQWMIFWSFFDGSKEYDVYYSVDEDSLKNRVEYGTLSLTDLSKGQHKIYMQGRAGSEKTNVAVMEFEVT